MADGIHPDILKIVYSREAEDAFRRCKVKDNALFQRLKNQINKILRDPSEEIRQAFGK